MQETSTTSEEPSTSSITPTPESREAEVSEETSLELPPPKDNKFDPTRWNEEQRQKRRDQVWRMTVVDRMTQAEICKALGISSYTIYQDLKWVRKQRVKTLEEADKDFVVEQDQIYDSLLDKWLPIALRTDDDSEASFTATDKVTTVLANQAKLHGFGAAGKVSAKQAGEVMGDFVLKAMRQIAHGNVIQAEVIDENLPKLGDTKGNEETNS
jgi:hypothetical protein